MPVNPVDPVDASTLYQPLAGAELDQVKPMTAGIGFLQLLGLGLIVAGLTLAPDNLPSYLIVGGFCSLYMAFNAVYLRAKGLHKRVAALSQAVTALRARTYR